MGAWGPAIFSDDVACDVRDQYRELLEDQVPDDEAEQQVLDAFHTDEVESIADRPMPTVILPDPDDPWRFTHRVVVPHRDDTWDAAGFVRIGTVGPRPDDDALVTQVYCGFSSTAGDLRRTAARLAGEDLSG